MKFLTKALLPLLLILLLILTSCNSTTETPEVTDDLLGSESVEITEKQNEEIKPLDPENIQISVSNDGKVNFSVIRPNQDSITPIVTEGATAIYKAIGELLGTMPKLKNDTADHNDSYEILVGHTSHPETAEAMLNCGYGDYLIDVIGNKIVIWSYDEDGITSAVNDFINSLKENYDETSGVIKLKESEFGGTESFNELLSAIPVFEGGEFYSYYDAGTRDGKEETQCDEIILSSTTPQLYYEYLKKVEESGFEKYANHTMANNRFATFTSEDYVLTVGFYDYSDEVRILIEDSSAPLPTLQSDYTKVTDSQITMIGLEYDKGMEEFASNGMSMLIRLEDGRFVVIDGGHNHAQHTTNIQNAIREQAKEYTDEPVIAAWIITHAHGDHFGMINAAYKKFEGIKIERFLTNFMSESERARAMEVFPDNWTADEGGAFGKTYDAAAYVGADLHKVHVGQVFYFADLQIEVLFTMESYGPTPCNALNTTSLVMKMTFTNGGNETVYMSLADATGNSLELCTKMYGDYLKSDIVQTAHHGYSTWGNDAGVMMAYEQINATLVLWPMGLRVYRTYANKEYNKILFEVPEYKECYVAGGEGDYVTVKLPYFYGESEIELICAGNCPEEHYYKTED